jgi:dTMP kinase
LHFGARRAKLGGRKHHPWRPDVSSSSKGRLRRRGYACRYLREPSRGRFGREIRRLALRARSLTPEGELQLFLKDRRENVERNIRPALAGGRIVILDRYYYSTIAYQGAKGIDPGRIRRLNERFAPRPDLVFILDLGPEAGLSRIAGRKTRDALFEKAAYLARVRKVFRSLAGPRIVLLDARRPPADLAAEILSRTLERLREP